MMPIAYIKIYSTSLLINKWEKLKQCDTYFNGDAT